MIATRNRPLTLIAFALFAISLGSSERGFAQTPIPLFNSGAGGTQNTLASPATPGDGPGGGAAGSAVSLNCNAGTFSCGQGGQFSGTNRYLVPLIGGSGGGGALVGITCGGCTNLYRGSAGG